MFPGATQANAYIRSVPKQEKENDSLPPPQVVINTGNNNCNNQMVDNIEK